MAKSGIIVHGKYLDSVKLMLISKQLRQQDGISDAVVMTATPENRAILQATGFLLEQFNTAIETDIVIAVEADNPQIAEATITLATDWVEHGLPGAKTDVSAFRPHSIAGAVKIMPEASFALISVAGKYAANEARKALQNGLHVMLFSDNVSLEDEKELKELALAKDLLMMGPDCGTAIINGTPLAFANVVRSGAIGIVSASGTGLQEVSSIIHNLGGGITQAFGTGGRDGKNAIGGIMLCACLQYLIEDADTQVIVLLAKTPDPEIIDKLWKIIRSTSKPVVVNFLKDMDLESLPNVTVTTALSETAVQACKRVPDLVVRPLEATFTNRKVVALPKSNTRKYLRGLYSGGTLCYEAQNIFRRETGITAFSNAPIDHNFKLDNALESREHTIIDLGSDEFTVGRLHPMIDFSLRLNRIAEEAKDPETAVILLDIVLGYGAHPAPQEELAPLAKSISGEVVVICAITGTDEDPQNRQNVVKALQNAGAIVTLTHAAACKLAAGIIKSIGRL